MEQLEERFEKEFGTDFKGTIGFVRGDKLCCRGDLCEGHGEDMDNIKLFIKKERLKAKDEEAQGVLNVLNKLEDSGTTPEKIIQIIRKRLINGKL